MAVRHFLIDWETLDTASSAVVLSCNIMCFDPKLNDPVVDSSTVSFVKTVEEQLAKGRTISNRTLQFWLQQSEFARNALFGGSNGFVAASVVEGLLHMGEVIKRNTQAGDFPSSDFRAWGNGSDFDIAILNSLRQQFHVGDKIPFSHRGHRCARTVMAGFPYLRVQPSPSQAHDPYFDNAAMAMSLKRVYDLVPVLVG